MSGEAGASGNDARNPSGRTSRAGGIRGDRPRLRLISDNSNPVPSSSAVAAIDVRAWTAWAMRLLADERAKAADTPLIPIPCPELPGINFILKDESRHPTGSLKHRLAHALFVEGIASGAIGPETVIVEASSGSTAISEAWFARKLGLRYIAVVPATTAPAKLAAILAEGGEFRFAHTGNDLGDVAEATAHMMGGYYMDQFDRAADAPDWRANNIASELIAQLDAFGLKKPAWIVTGAGTGGSSAVIGRHIRSKPELADTRLCVVDPEGSAYFAAYVAGDLCARGCSTPIVEGVGRGRVSRAFLPQVIDHMVAVSDEGSVAGAHWLANRIDRRFGPSTGTNMIGALILGQAMVRLGERGTIALLGCDSGERYTDTVYDADFCTRHGLADGGWRELLTRLGSAEFPAAY